MAPDTLSTIGEVTVNGRHYRVPKPEALPVSTEPAGPPQRLLAAIFIQGDRTWFFKLTGSPEEVEKHQGEFEHFIQSVRFKKGDPPITWTAPEGWQREGKTALRVETFRFGSKENPLELSVTPLGREAGSLLDNVNRWRGQLGLKNIDEAELNKIVRELDVDGVKAMLVDLTGIGSAKGRMNAPFAKAHPPVRPRENREEAPAALPLTFRAPLDWKERAPRGGISLATYDITDGDRAAEITITRAGGNLADNVNRWRGQVGLNPVSEEQIRQDLRSIDVDGRRPTGQGHEQHRHRRKEGAVCGFERAAPAHPRRHAVS